MEIKNYGYQEPIISEEEHYILGDGWFQGAILMPSGHGWGNYLPVAEMQAKNGIETYNCSNYGTWHALAPLGKKKFGIQFQTNFSERYSGVMTGTVPGAGNDPHTVIETIRTVCGGVPEVFLPFDDSVKNIDGYYSPKPMSYTLFAIGKHWLKKYKVSHQWLWGNGATLAQKQQAMKQALQYSPLGASVFAWSNPDAGGIYYGRSDIHNHWITVFDYVEGQYWLIFDSYDKQIKKLSWDFDFGVAKGYGLDFNVGGQTLGEAPEPVKLQYLAYRVSSYFGNILK